MLYKMTEYYTIPYDSAVIPEIKRTYIGTWNKCMIKMYGIAEANNSRVFGKFGPCVNLMKYDLYSSGEKTLIEIERLDAMLL